MAKVTENEKTTYIGIAKRFLKYNGKFIQEGQRFEVNNADEAEMKAFVYKVDTKEGV